MPRSLTSKVDTGAATSTCGIIFDLTAHNVHIAVAGVNAAARVTSPAIFYSCVVELKVAEINMNCSTARTCPAIGDRQSIKRYYGIVNGKNRAAIVTRNCVIRSANRQVGCDRG